MGSTNLLMRSLRSLWGADGVEDGGYSDQHHRVMVEEQMKQKMKMKMEKKKQLQKMKKKKKMKKMKAKEKDKTKKEEEETGQSTAVDGKDDETEEKKKKKTDKRTVSINNKDDDINVSSGESSSGCGGAGGSAETAAPATATTTARTTTPVRRVGSDDTTDDEVRDEDEDEVDDDEEDDEDEEEEDDDGQKARGKVDGAGDQKDGNEKKKMKKMKAEDEEDEEQKKDLDNKVCGAVRGEEAPLEGRGEKGGGSEEEAVSQESWTAAIAAAAAAVTPPTSPRRSPVDGKQGRTKNESDKKNESENDAPRGGAGVRAKGTTMFGRLRRAGTLAGLFSSSGGGGKQEQQSAGAVDHPDETEVPEWAQPSVGEEMVGFMYKEGGRWKTWKERWFILKEGELVYKPSPLSKEVLGRVNLMKGTISLVERYTNAKFETRTCITVTGGPAGREFYMFCEDSPSSTILWHEAIVRSVSRMRRKQSRGIKTSDETSQPDSHDDSGLKSDSSM